MNLILLINNRYFTCVFHNMFFFVFFFIKLNLLYILRIELTFGTVRNEQEYSLNYLLHRKNVISNLSGYFIGKLPFLEAFG